MNSKYAYQDPWVKIRIDEIEENGEKKNYTVLERGDATVIIPLSTSEKTLLLEEFRHPSNSNFWGFPMGFIDKGETAEEAAKRELSEETNMAGELVEIGIFYPAPGLSPQTVKVFICNISDVELENSQLNKNEKDIKRKIIIDLSTLKNKVKNGEITDGFTLSAISFLNNLS